MKAMAPRRWTWMAMLVGGVCGAGIVRADVTGSGDGQLVAKTLAQPVVVSGVLA